MKKIAEHIHFIGIGGIGMSGLARICLGFNIRCSGSDARESTDVQALRKLGAVIYIGHRREHLADDVDLVVYSSAIKAGNPELQAAYERGIKVICRAELLSMIMTERDGIAVAGTHGKTTTTGMLGTMLAVCGLDPTIIIGGKLPYIGANACWGKGRYLVAEADESDGSFLLLKHKIAVVTNVESDHLDHYGNMDNLLAAFSQFVKQTPADGFSVLCIDDPFLAALSKEAPGKYVTYSLKDESADFTAKNIVYEGFGSRADVYHHGELMGSLRLNKPGSFNVSNALAAIAVGQRLGLDFAEIAAGLAAFNGTGRRFELLGQNTGGDIVVVDDYAHHPTEIGAVLTAARNLGFKRLLAVFQPHRYSRTQLLADEFGRVLSCADVVIINAIYGAFEPPIEGVSAQLIVRATQKNNQHVYYAKEMDDVVSLMREQVRPGDLVLVMGAGDIRRAGEIFAASL